MKKLFSILTIALLVLNVNAQIDRSKAPKTGPSPTVQLGTPQTFTLKNGLTVMVVENHKLPRASATLSIRNTPLFEGKKAGVSDMLSSLLGNGTTSVSKDEFNKQVEFLGANVNFWSSGARASSLSKYFDKIFDMMIDGALKPKFTQEDFDTEIKKTVEGLKSNENSVKAVASNLQNALTFGKKNPFGEFTTLETLKNVTLEDVQKLYSERFRPNNAYLVITGDVDFKKIKKKVKKAFKKWKKTDFGTYSFPEVLNPKTTEINFVDMPNAVQSELAVQSAIDLKMNDKDYHAVIVANEILGGSFNSYLNMNLREANGWTYGARTSTKPSKYKAAFKAQTSVRNSVTDSAIVETMKEINRIKTEFVSEKDLKNVKAKYVGNFVLSLEKPESIASYALNMKVNNLPNDFYKTYLAKIDAVTAEDVKRVANKYFKDNNARIIIVGKGTDVVPALEKLPYKINFFDKNGNTVAKPVFKKEIPTGVTAKTVVSAMVKALGGKEKLNNVKSVIVVSEGAIQGQAIEMKTTKTTPNKFNMSMVLKQMGMEIMNMSFDGNEAKLMAQGQSMPIPKEGVKKMKAKKSIFTPLNLMSKLDKVTLESIEKVNGKDAYKLVSENTKYYVDTQSNLIVSTSEKNGDKEQVSSYSDYKNVDGIQFPHSTTMPMGPMNVEFKTKSITVQ